MQIKRTLYKAHGGLLYFSMSIHKVDLVMEKLDFDSGVFLCSLNKPSLDNKYAICLVLFVSDRYER